MKQLLIGLAIGAALGGAAGFAVGIFVFPYLFAPPPAMEPLVFQHPAPVPDREAPQPIGEAVFIHANPADPIHYGSGTATLYPGLVRLEPDFAVGPGPKYHVYLVPDADVTPDTDVAATMFVDLGRLRAFSGSQNYPVPDGVDLARFGSVVIWCEQFGVLISPARIAHRGV